MDVSARGVADVGGIKVERLVIRHQTFTQVSDVRYSLYWLTDFVYQYWVISIFCVPVYSICKWFIDTLLNA